MHHLRKISAGKHNGCANSEIGYQHQMPLMNQGLLWPFQLSWKVTEILCSFRLVLEGKAGKETFESSRLEFLEKFLANNFTLSDAEDNTFRLLNKKCIADLPLFKTHSNFSKVPGAKFLWSDGLFCFISICKFGSFKNCFALITGLFELFFRFRRFILLIQTKKSDFYELWQHHKQLKSTSR